MNPTARFVAHIGDLSQTVGKLREAVEKADPRSPLLKKIGTLDTGLVDIRKSLDKPGQNYRAIEEQALKVAVDIHSAIEEFSQIKAAAPQPLPITNKFETKKENPMTGTKEDLYQEIEDIAKREGGWHKCAASAEFQAKYAEYDAAPPAPLVPVVETKKVAVTKQEKAWEQIEVEVDKLMATSRVQLTKAEATLRVCQEHPELYSEASN